jgi:ubiquinone/menaquinone biosynthesis C-methylase UbiE
MERLIKENINTSAEYDRIYLERSKKSVDSQDMRRWKRLLHFYRGGKLVDLGCLDSEVDQLVLHRNSFFDSYLGIDISEVCIIEGRKRWPSDKNIEFELGDVYNTRFGDNTFDYAILGEVIEHLEHPVVAIGEAMRILKKGGILAISTPLEEAKEVGAVDGERHLWSFSKKDIINLLSPYGKVKVETLGSEWFPYKYHWKTIVAFCTKK